MSPIPFRQALSIKALVLPVFLLLTAPAAFAASAEMIVNPMSALAGRPASGTPMDPMAALRAPPKAEDAAAGNPELGGFPDGPGAEETFYQCTACHSTELIKQQRVTDTRWDELWKWMVEAQGMGEPDAETKAVILGYLKQTFSSER